MKQVKEPQGAQDATRTMGKAANIAVINLATKTSMPAMKLVKLITVEIVVTNSNNRRIRTRLTGTPGRPKACISDLKTNEKRSQQLNDITPQSRNLIPGIKQANSWQRGSNQRGRQKKSNCKMKSLKILNAISTATNARPPTRGLG